MTEFEELLKEDSIYKKILIENDFKIQSLKINTDLQKETAKKGKPNPVLSLGKQYQPTKKSVNELSKKEDLRITAIEKMTSKELKKREEELAKLHPKIYREYLIEKMKEKAKENMLDRENER